MKQTALQEILSLSHDKANPYTQALAHLVSAGLLFLALQPLGGSLEFFIDIVLPAALWAWG